MTGPNGPPAQPGRLRTLLRSRDPERAAQGQAPVVSTAVLTPTEQKERDEELRRLRELVQHSRLQQPLLETCPATSCEYKFHASEIDSFHEHYARVHGDAVRIRCPYPHCAFICALADGLVLLTHFQEVHERRCPADGCEFVFAADEPETFRRHQHNVHEMQRCPWHPKLRFPRVTREDLERDLLKVPFFYHLRSQHYTQLKELLRLSDGKVERALRKLYHEAPGSEVEAEPGERQQRRLLASPDVSDNASEESEEEDEGGHGDTTLAMQDLAERLSREDPRYGESSPDAVQSHRFVSPRNRRQYPASRGPSSKAATPESGLWGSSSSSSSSDDSAPGLSKNAKGKRPEKRGATVQEEYNDDYYDYDSVGEGEDGFEELLEASVAQFWADEERRRRSTSGAGPSRDAPSTPSEDGGESDDPAVGELTLLEQLELKQVARIAGVDWKEYVRQDKEAWKTMSSPAQETEKKKTLSKQGKGKKSTDSASKAGSKSSSSKPASAPAASQSTTTAPAATKPTPATSAATKATTPASQSAQKPTQQKTTQSKATKQTPPAQTPPNEPAPATSATTKATTPTTQSAQQPAQQKTTQSQAAKQNLPPQATPSQPAATTPAAAPKPATKESSQPSAPQTANKDASETKTTQQTPANKVHYLDGSALPSQQQKHGQSPAHDRHRRQPSPDWVRETPGAKTPKMDKKARFYCSRCLRKAPITGNGDVTARMQIAAHTDPGRSCRIRNALGSLETGLPNRSGWIPEKDVKNRLTELREEFRERYPEYVLTMYPLDAKHLNASSWESDPNNEENSAAWGLPWPPYEGGGKLPGGDDDDGEDAGQGDETEPEPEPESSSKRKSPPSKPAEQPVPKARKTAAPSPPKEQTQTDDVPMHPPPRASKRLSPEKPAEKPKQASSKRRLTDSELMPPPPLPKSVQNSPQRNEKTKRPPPAQSKGKSSGQDATPKRPAEDISFDFEPRSSKKAKTTPTSASDSDSSDSSSDDGDAETAPQGVFHSASPEKQRELVKEGVQEYMRAQEAEKAAEVDVSSDESTDYSDEDEEEQDGEKGRSDEDNQEGGQADGQADGQENGQEEGEEEEDSDDEDESDDDEDSSDEGDDSDDEDDSSEDDDSGEESDSEGNDSEEDDEGQDDEEEPPSAKEQPPPSPKQPNPFVKFMLEKAAEVDKAERAELTKALQARQRDIKKQERDQERREKALRDAKPQKEAAAAEVLALKRAREAEPPGTRPLESWKRRRIIRKGKQDNSPDFDGDTQTDDEPQPRSSRGRRRAGVGRRMKVLPPRPRGPRESLPVPEDSLLEEEPRTPGGSLDIPSPVIDAAAVPVPVVSTPTGSKGMLQRFTGTIGAYFQPRRTPDKASPEVGRTPIERPIADQLALSPGFGTSSPSLDRQAPISKPTAPQSSLRNVTLPPSSSSSSSPSSDGYRTAPDDSPIPLFFGRKPSTLKRDSTGKPKTAADRPVPTIETATPKPPASSKEPQSGSSRTRSSRRRRKPSDPNYVFPSRLPSVDVRDMWIEPEPSPTKRRRTKS